MAVQDDGDTTVVKTRATVQYPEQTLAKVTLLSPNKDDLEDLICDIAEEIRQYLNLFQ